MTRKADQPCDKPEPQIDPARRKVLKQLGKAAYVAPAVTLIPMDSLAGPGNACSNFTPDIMNPNCRR